jgi:hypothetical protein
MLQTKYCQFQEYYIIHFRCNTCLWHYNLVCSLMRISIIAKPYQQI